MKHLITTIATVLSFGAALFFIEQDRRGDLASASAGAPEAADSRAGTFAVRAAGRIQGRTEEIELRPRIVGTIQEICVRRGQRVSQGDVLIRLDTEQLVHECELAAALVDAEKAQHERLVNGNRPSEIERARQEYLAAKARMVGTQSAYRRALDLADRNAVSQQRLDDLSAQLHSQRASTAAAEAQLQVLEEPPRAEDVLAAEAALRAAEARREIARTQLAYAQLRAPADGEILAVEAEIGELANPDSARPLIVMSDTSRLKAVAEIDQFDALRLQLGQRCRIEADGVEGTLAVGEIVEIAPQMNRKQLFGHWAGERNDTHGRRVWVALEPVADLPVGLPVDVFIDAPPPDYGDLPAGSEGSSAGFSSG